MDTSLTNLDELYGQMADHFRAAGDLFTQLSSADAVQSLLHTLATNDQAAFDQWVNRVDIKLIGKCAWVRELVMVVVSSVVMIDEYYLRKDLTPDEEWLLFRLCIKYKTLVQDDLPIAEGAFLDELKANGLVTLIRKPGIISDLIERPGKPSRICF